MKASAVRPECTFDELASKVGQQLGVSSWVLMDQARIDEFARITGDDGFVHVDAEKTAKTALGKTIAHGLLTVSMVGTFLKETTPVISDRAYLLAYGWDRIRFLSPVPRDSHLRGKVSLLSAERKSKDRGLLRYGITIETDTSDKPAAVGEWLLMVILIPSP